MTTASIITALWPGLVKHLKAIGRQLLTWARRWLGRELIAFMRRRISVFEKRREKTQLAWRKRWLAGRTKRWTAAADWLDEWRDEYRPDVCRRNAYSLMKRAREAGIPLVSPQEREPRRAAA